ncbi:MAG: HEAT repeat domain-containing protein [Planctomycetota bacterium]|nr:HEAT repeat domain-containing protein [Planctomycetota bacterium]
MTRNTLTAHRLSLTFLVVVSSIVGCDTMSSDFQMMSQSFSPPTPGEAAAWAVDPTNPTMQRKGLALLSSASFGGNNEYLELYRFTIEESPDPLVKSAAITALARHGTPEDATLIAKQLRNPNNQIRWSAARGLQRLYLPSAETAIWTGLLLANDEREDIRAELALALGQYRSDSAFQALIAALDQPELSVNTAAQWSLWIMTGQDHGLNRVAWLQWYESVPRDQRFTAPDLYLYLTYARRPSLFEKVWPFGKNVWELPGLPRGMPDPGHRSTGEIRDTPVAPATTPAG